MTEEAAIDLMVRQAFQEEDEARAKWLRARLTSTQLSTYYVGAVEMLDLEVEARIRAAVAARLQTCRHARRIGDTPGFDYRTHSVGHLARHAAHPLGPPHPRREGAPDARSRPSVPCYAGHGSEPPPLGALGSALRPSVGCRRRACPRA